jgi:hypothetical protein
VDLANQPPLSDEVIKDRALAWCDALFPNVEERRLTEAFDRAIAKHETTFPISVHEILVAAKALQAEEFAKREAEDFESRRKSEAMSPDYKECPSCQSCGWRKVFDRDAWGKEHWGAVRCYDCDYWQRRKERKISEGHYKN